MDTPKSPFCQSFHLPMTSSPGSAIAPPGVSWKRKNSRRWSARECLKRGGAQAGLGCASNAAKEHLRRSTGESQAICPSEVSASGCRSLPLPHTGKDRPEADLTSALRRQTTVRRSRPPRRPRETIQGFPRAGQCRECATRGADDSLIEATCQRRSRRKSAGWTRGRGGSTTCGRRRVASQQTVA